MCYQCVMELHASVAAVLPYTKANENKIEPQHNYFAHWAVNSS